MARPRKRAPHIKGYLPDSQDELCKRISDCENVIRHLAECPAWEVINNDLKLQMKVIDDNWHLTNDEKQLNEFRVTKFAVMHLLNLKQKYEEDLKNSQGELNKLQTVEKSIVKDYDLETQTEG